MSVHRIASTIVLVGLSAFLWGGCASSKPDVEPPALVPVHQYPVKAPRAQEEKPERKAQEAPDLYATGGDDWTPTWKPNLPQPRQFDLNEKRVNRTESASNDTTSTDSVHTHQERGYRVQLANVLSEDQAHAIQARATALFENIYIMFRSPNYKVRAGDFTKRSDADKAAAEAKRLGFRGAWVVPDKVNVKD